MVGEGKRFVDYGFTINKYLLPINKLLTPMISEAITTLNIVGRFIFIIREENGFVNTSLRNLLLSICPDCVILSVDKLTDGAATSAYIAKDYIDNDDPLFISNSDQILDYDFDRFYQTCIRYDGCVLTYTPDYPITIGSTDKHSFIKVDENGYGVEVEEKIAVSNLAIVGLHYYKCGKYYIEAYKHIVENNIRAPNGEFYISNTYQAMIKLRYKIGSCNLEQGEYFYPVGTPSDYFKYYNKHCPIIQSNALLPRSISIINLEKDSSMILNNCLVKVVQGSIDNYFSIFTTGQNLQITASTATTLFVVKYIDKPYGEIDIGKYMRGWILGNFEPSLKKTSFEVGFLHHQKDEKWQYHYHKRADEINILCKGKMIINDILFVQGDMFVFSKNTISCPIFLEDCDVICIKTISDKRDKYII